jgi:hypothetical protein
MSNMVAIKKVVLAEHHLPPGRTKHTLCDERGSREFPPFVSLVIAQYPGDSGYSLLHLCEDEHGTDTCHESIDDSFHQAEYEFDVNRRNGLKRTNLSEVRFDS